MSGIADTDTEQRWACPPEDERHEDPEPPRITPDGADPRTDRVIIRLIHWTRTDELVRFVLVQQTYHRGSWRDVVEVDTRHDVDAHLHQYVRSTGQRNGGAPEVVSEIFSVEDVQQAYLLAYDRVIGAWELNRRRWHDG